MESKKRQKNSLFSEVIFFDIKRFRVQINALKSHSIKFNFCFLLLFALACFAVFLSFYPGVLVNYDPFFYFKSASGINVIYYWQAPFIQYFWRFLGVFGGLYLFNLTCYWLGVTLTAYALFESIYARLLVVLAFGFFPSNLNFITYMIADSIVFSTLILAMSFILIYVFRVKKVVFLWFALSFIFVATGVKQNLITYTCWMILIVAHLMLKHYAQYKRLPFFSHKKKTHIAVSFLILLTAIFGSVSYINSKYESNKFVMWNGLIFWDLMATSVYSQKDLFYPVLIKPEFQHKISSKELLDNIKTEFNPARNINIWLAPKTNEYVKSFSTLTLSDKIFILNQLLSNPVAYLYHRLEVAKYMLLSTDYPKSGIDKSWAVFNITTPNNELANTLQNILTHLNHLNLKKSIKVFFFYQMITLLFIWSLLKIAPFSTYHNSQERVIILCLSCASFLLFMTLIFVAPSNNFRYQTPALYTAEISCLLWLRALYKYCALQYTWKNLATMMYKWNKFIYSQMKFLVILIATVFLVVAITKHNKNVLRNHFNPILLNNTVDKTTIPSLYKTIIANSTPVHIDGYDIYVNQQMIILKRNACTSLDEQHSFFLHVFPQHRFDLYINRLLTGYDELTFNFVQNGVTLSDNQTCLILTYLPQYSINRMTIGQMSSGHKLLWQTNLQANIKTPPH